MLRVNPDFLSFLVCNIVNDKNIKHLDIDIHRSYTHTHTLSAQCHTTHTY